MTKIHESGAVEGGWMDGDTGMSSSEVAYAAGAPHGALPGWEAKPCCGSEGGGETHEVLHDQMPPQHPGNGAFLKHRAGEGGAALRTRGATGIPCPLCSTNIPPRGSVVVRCSDIKERGFFSCCFQAWGAESTWNFPLSPRVWQGRRCPGPNPWGAVVEACSRVP